jgi:hypothetical protein
VPKWKKGAKEFTVGVNYNEVRGYQSSIPKPVMEALGEPKTLTFVINGSNVSIQTGQSTNISMEQNNMHVDKRKGAK